MEALQAPALLRALQEEVRQVFNPTDHTIDVPKLLALPLLQSVYTETLRLHITFNMLRRTTAAVVMDPGFAIAKDALLFAPIELAHRDERSWGVPGHPAAEFWGERHVRYRAVEEGDGVENGGQGEGKRAEFVMGSRDPNMFFPFGGGSSICPGRHFAKQEIFMMVAVLLEKFDVEFVEWTTMDGKRSDRAARDDQTYAGAIGMPPDRDMKVRLVRRW